MFFERTLNMEKYEIDMKDIAQNLFLISEGDQHLPI